MFAWLWWEQGEPQIDICEESYISSDDGGDFV